MLSSGGISVSSSNKKVWREYLPRKKKKPVNLKLELSFLPFSF
jgi:hypothetical protein